MSTVTADTLRDYIDHTLLKPEATREQIEALCKEAAEHQFHSVCVNSCWVSFCAELLKGHGSSGVNRGDIAGDSRVKVCTVVGFPLGAMETKAKAFEAENAVSQGADEVDMVLNIGALKSGDIESAERDVRAVREACGKGTILKVIIETALLNETEKIEACKIVKRGGADFVKTSTGFASGGATVSDVALMRKTVGPEMGIKAAGGIRSFEDAVAMIDAGATRLGTSSGAALVQGGRPAGNNY